MSIDIIPVVISGGSGSRLWPQSRLLFPKQFLTLAGEHSMLQNTLIRLDGLNASLDGPLVVTHQDYRFLVAEQLRQIGKAAKEIILEPIGRNTAPAIALAAIEAKSEKKDPMLLVLPCDHIIRNIDAFHRAVETALPAAQEGSLAAFGVVPDKPETAYGYIKVTYRNNGSAAMKVKSFFEKPDFESA